VFAGVVPEEEWTEETKLWLSRSVLGEVGWNRPREWTAVAYVYARRAARSKRHTFLQMIKAYSAAVGPQGKVRSPWLFELGFDKSKPKSWPLTARWNGVHDREWIRVLVWADYWQAGHLPDPCPRADHFGGSVDYSRAKRAGFTRLYCRGMMRNHFYTAPRYAGRKGKVQNVYDSKRD